MKIKFSWIIFVLLLIGLSALFTFYFDESPYFILWPILCGLAIGILVLLIKSFLKPPSWYFNNRHMIEGGLFFMLMMVFLDFIGSSLFIFIITSQGNFWFYFWDICTWLFTETRLFKIW